MNGPDSSESQAGGRPSPFPKTTDSVWERIQQARDGDAEALGKLCVIYQKPILAYVLRWNPNHQEAEDLAQKFIARMLGKNPFQKFERRDVKFRSFLLLCLKNFLRDEWARGKIVIDDPELSGESVEDHAEKRETVSTLDVALAWDIHDRVLRRLAEERYASEDMRARFDRLQPFILGVDESYADLAGPLGMNPVALRKCVHDLRERHHDSFRQAVTDLVARDQIVEEMRYLLGLLAYPRPDVGKSSLAL